MLTDFGHSNIIGERGFTSSIVIGTSQYMSPELLSQDESGEREDAGSVMKETKECDVYAFSMVGVEVSLFQMVHILVLQGHHHRFYLDNNLTPT